MVLKALTRVFAAIRVYDMLCCAEVCHAVLHLSCVICRGNPAAVLANESQDGGEEQEGDESKEETYDEQEEENGRKEEEKGRGNSEQDSCGWLRFEQGNRFI